MRGSKIKLRMKNTEGVIQPIHLKMNRHSFMTARKRKTKLDRGNKKSPFMEKVKDSHSQNKNYIVGMEYCLFKREVDDDAILERFLGKHFLENNEYNIHTLREFAETSIESPIDFKNIIKRMQRKVGSDEVMV